MYRNKKIWVAMILIPKKYNKLIKTEKESNVKIKKKDHKYDFFIPIKYNFQNLLLKGSCIFIHLTKIMSPQLGVLL